MTPAETAVVALENLPAGEPWGEAAEAAEAAIAAERAAAERVLFPLELRPVSGDALAAYAFHIGRINVPNYAAGLAEIHRRALATHPELAALCRGVDALADVEAAAASRAVPDRNESHASAGVRAAAAARQRFMVELARQLAEAPGYELAEAARALLAAEALAGRLAAARLQHEEHARAELARAQEEHARAARAVIDRTVERVRAAAAAAEDARQRAELSAQEYRKVRGEALVERLRLSGLKSLRVGSGGEVYDVADIIAGAPLSSTEQLGVYERALAAHEGAR